MAADAGALAGPAPRATGRSLGAPLLTGGIAVTYLSLVVLLPLAALAARAHTGGWHDFWAAARNPQAVAALKLTLGLACGVVAVNAGMGTLIAWVLVRDRFFGKSLLNAVIDLPFALPTIVASLTLLTLYGPRSRIHNLAFTRAGVLVALLFVTLPFVVRTVQPVLLELDRDMEEAAASLGAGKMAIFRRIVFPNLFPAILSGVALAFARAIGEFGAVVLLSGNLPFKTEVASVFIFSQLNADNTNGAAALSLELLGISFLVLIGIGALRRWAIRHDR